MKKGIDGKYGAAAAVAVLPLAGAEVVALPLTEAPPELGCVASAKQTATSLGHNSCLKLTNVNMFLTGVGWRE